MSGKVLSWDASFFRRKKRSTVKIFDFLLNHYSPLEGESKSLILERGND